MKTDSKKKIARRAPLLARIAPIAASTLACIVPVAWAADTPEGDLPPMDAQPSIEASAPTRDWTLVLEAAGLDTKVRDNSRAAHSRASLDFRFDKKLAPQWRMVVAHRIDSFDPLSDSDRRSTVPLLKEAYIGWQPVPEWAAEAGRVNLRLGSAVGYNPTDFFKARAVPTLVSLDPESRRKNRLGSVMLRGESLWESGAASLVLSPRLAAEPSSGRLPAGDSLSRTNGQDRALAILSQRVAGEVQVRGLAYAEQGRSPQFGFDASALLNPATVVYAEWAGGSMATLPNEAAGIDSDTRFRSRAAAGGTYTFPFGLSLTVEAQANEAAPRKGEWQVLRATNPLAWGRALQWAFDCQELPARRSLFVYGQWRDAIVRRFDLSGFVQADEGSARQYWFEARRRFEGFDIALRWQAQRGPAWSRFGAASEQRSAQLIGTLYF